MRQSEVTTRDSGGLVQERSQMTSTKSVLQIDRKLLNDAVKRSETLST